MISMLEQAAKSVLDNYPFGEGTTFELVNVSENWTYRVDDPTTGKSFALRIHRPNYHSHDEIESELTWIDALQSAKIVNVPPPVAAHDGSRVCTIGLSDGSERHATVFEWLSGEAPSTEGDMSPNFRILGGLAAKMHKFASEWTPPASFRRFTYDDTAVLEKALWGRWRDAPGIGEAEAEILARADSEIRRQLAAHGRTSDRFGLCHNDLRPANLLIDGDVFTVIDFDDSGYSWFMNDFATAISFMEHDPRVPEWMAAWLEGYTAIRPISAEIRSILPTMIMLRRMLLVGWVGFHHEHAAEAQELGAPYAVGACELSERYLSGNFLA